MQRGVFKLVEECAGTGQLIDKHAVVREVRYTLSRYQGMLEGSGMPIPGLHRVEGSVDYDGTETPDHLVGSDFTLRLEDGRTLAITLAGRDGRILSVGHGPGRGCSCC